MTRLIIHIGAHKTATTSVQKYLNDDTDQLAELGVYYPHCCWYHFSQHRIAFAMKGMIDPAAGDVPSFEDEIAALRLSLERSDAPTAVISSEEFFSAKETEIARLQQQLSDFEIRIVAFLRRPDELYLSTYNQRMKEPDSNFRLGIAEGLDEPERVCPDIDLAANVRRWARVFGGDKVTIHRFEDGDPIRVVLEAAGVDPDILPPASIHINKSAPNAVIELMRIAKSTIPDPAIRRRLLTRAMKFFPADSTSPLTGEQRQAIVARYQPSLDELFAEFGMVNTYTTDNVASVAYEPFPGLKRWDLVRLIGVLIEESAATPAPPPETPGG